LIVDYSGSVPIPQAISSSREGDGRTPEGRYVLDSQNPNLIWQRVTTKAMRCNPFLIKGSNSLDCESYLFLKNLVNCLAIRSKIDYSITIQLSPPSICGVVLSVGTIHLSKWHPPVCEVENSKKGECYYG
jgi:hypothetical protein